LLASMLVFAFLVCVLLVFEVWLPDGLHTKPIVVASAKSVDGRFFSVEQTSYGLGYFYFTGFVYQRLNGPRIVDHLDHDDGRIFLFRCRLVVDNANRTVAVMRSGKQIAEYSWNGPAERRFRKVADDLIRLE